MKIRTVVGLICTFFSNVNVLIDKIEIKLKTHVFFSASASIKAPKTCHIFPSDFTYTYVYADHTGKICILECPPPSRSSKSWTQGRVRDQVRGRSPHH